MSDVLEVPRSLPVYNLSKSSIETYLQCPLRFKRRYLDREPERSNPSLILGSATGDAITAALQWKIDTKTLLGTADVLDNYADALDHKADTEDVDWGDTKPGVVKDQGAKLVKLYWESRGQFLEPIAVERKFNVDFDGAEWGVTGYIDIEEADRVIDLKTSAKAIGQADADSDLQATTYLWARWQEGRPARDFQFHSLKKTIKPAVDVVTTERTEAQFDVLSRRIIQVAREIVWRAETDCWQGAPPKAWYCSEKRCGFWSTCEYGGKFRSVEGTLVDGTP